MLDKYNIYSYRYKIKFELKFKKKKCLSFKAFIEPYSVKPANQNTYVGVLK